MRGRRRDSVSSGTGSSVSHSCNDDIIYEDDMSAPRLDVLKTKAESRALSETINVWIVELPIKAANDILIFCKDHIPDSDSVDLQHLRRFAKPNHLPVYLQAPGSSRTSSADSRRSVASNASNDSKLSSRSRSRMRRRRNSAASTMHLLICPATMITYSQLAALLLEQTPFAVDRFPLRLKEITVPLLAPTSIEQAQQWTTQYWPTLYRKTNPFGPHPSLVTRSEEEIRDEAKKFMSLAQQAARESTSNGSGICCGCVVVERKADRTGEIVAIAGDARLSGLHSEFDSDLAVSTGNVACHAVMRAIGMVARKRVRVAAPKIPRAAVINADIGPEELLVRPVAHVENTPESVAESLLDYPRSQLEQQYFDKDNLVPNGYLCVELEMYLTHEPCLMCSMAIVHSRFGRCIFAKRMPATGGMAGDAGLGYGLFWRSELNWKLLCWEMATVKGADVASLPESTQA